MASKGGFGNSSKGGSPGKKIVGTASNTNGRGGSKGGGTK